jgi:hypothetical protein
VIVLTVLGGVLPVAALLWGRSRAVREYRRLANTLDRIDGIIHDAAIREEDKMPAAEQVLTPRFNLGRMAYTYEWVQRLILEDALAELRGPAVLGLVGVALGTAGGVWGVLL